MPLLEKFVTLEARSKTDCKQDLSSVISTSCKQLRTQVYNSGIRAVGPTIVDIAESLFLLLCVVLEEDMRPIYEALQRISLTKSSLEIPKFARKDDGMDALIKIRELQQHFKQNFIGKDKEISWGSNEKGESGTFVPLPSDATKQVNLSIPRSNGVLPKPSSSTGQGSKPTSAKHMTDALDEVSRAAYEQPSTFQFGSLSPIFMNAMQIPARTSSAPPNLDEQKHNEDQLSSQRAKDNMKPPFKYNIQHSSQAQFSDTPTRPLVSLQSPTMHFHQGLMHQGQHLKFTQAMLPPPQVVNQYISQWSKRAVKITHPDIHEELKLDSNRERFACFPKTLWIDDHKSVNCDDGQSVLTLDTVAFDPRVINYDSPFVLTVGTMCIDTRVCGLRVPTLGTMVVSTIPMDSSIPNTDIGRSVVFSNIQTAGEIRVIFSIPEQCQTGFMLEDARIFDNRAMNFFSTLPQDRGKECIMELESTYLDQFEASNAAESSKVKAQKLFFELKRVVEKCLVGDMGFLNGVPSNEPLDIETELVLGFLKHHMLGTPIASLRKNHLESGLGDAIVGGGIEDKLVQPQFNISLKSVAEHDEKRVEDLTMSILKMLVDEDLLSSVPLFCQSLLGDQFLVNPTVEQVEESEFDFLLASTANAILLIEGYSDFLIKEILLQAGYIIQGYLHQNVTNRLKNLLRVHVLRLYKIKSKMPQMKAISSLRVLTILTKDAYIKEDGIIESDEVVEMDEDEEDELTVVDGEVEGWKKKQSTSCNSDTKRLQGGKKRPILFNHLTTRYKKRKVMRIEDSTDPKKGMDIACIVSRQNLSFFRGLCIVVYTITYASSSATYVILEIPSASGIPIIPHGVPPGLEPHCGNVLLHFPFYAVGESKPICTNASS
eukprot:Gb_32560 [translate_table: standard]